LKCRSELWDKGFTLIEIIVVLAIMAIFAALAVPNFISIKEKASKTVCNANCLQFKRMYEAYLILENIDHTYAIFAEYLQEYEKNICPDQGDINYINGKVRCSVHSKGDNVESDDEGNEGVPFL
jgi:prepilin-type N-terminal cleavage/methylation domain-containing protein